MNNEASWDSSHTVSTLNKGAGGYWYQVLDDHAGPGIATLDASGMKIGTR